MSKRTYRLHRICRRKVAKLRDARDEMLLQWKGPYGDFLYHHCLETDLEIHTIIDGIEQLGHGWLHLWKAMVNETNAISYYQAMHHQQAWSGGGGSDFRGGTQAWQSQSQPPIEPRFVDGRFLEAPQWSVYHGKNQYGMRAPHAPEIPHAARPPIRFGPAEPPFAYYELEANHWNTIYSYQVPIAPPDSHGAGPRPRQVLPLRPWNLPESQISSENSINMELTNNYIRVSKRVLQSLREEFDQLEEQWRDFERRSECESNRSDNLKYLDMAISEMWRTRHFVRKVRIQLRAGETLGEFSITMPKRRSSRGATWPSWDQRGVDFHDLVAEAGLKDRDGYPLYDDPDAERRQRARDREFAQARQQAVLNKFNAEADAKAKVENQEQTERLLAAITGNASNEEVVDGGATAPEVDLVDPAPVAAPAEAKAGAGPSAAARQNDPTADGGGSSTDPNNGGGPPDGHRIIISVPANPPLVAPPGGEPLPHVSAPIIEGWFPPVGHIDEDPFIPEVHLAPEPQPFY